MRIIVVGGTGLIGGHAALYLKSQGHSVAIAGRHPPAAGSALGALEYLRCDYVACDLPKNVLAGFDALVFAAGNDIRHLPPGGDESSFWQRNNIEGVPHFFAAAREAGIGCAVQIGSFYPQAMPSLVERSAYVRSRHLADAAARALATPRFRVVSVNPPFVVGSVPGLVVGMFQAYTAYAEGKMAQVPAFVPPGGVNFISTRSLSEAVEGALLRGESGKAYLIGDQNLSWQDYFGAFFEAVGRPKPPIIDQEHPFLPDSALYFGRGNFLYYTPDEREARLLGYRRGHVLAAIGEVVSQYRTQP